MDILQLLKEDHQSITLLFAEFKALSSDASSHKHAKVEQIHRLLSAHSQLEEELVYPILSEVHLQEMETKIQEAYANHEVIQTLLAELGGLRPDDAHYDAKVTVMGKYMQRHIKQEEEHILPLAQQYLSLQRLAELSTRAEARRQELLENQNSKP